MRLCLESSVAACWPGWPWPTRSLAGLGRGSSDRGTRSTESGQTEKLSLSTLALTSWQWGVNPGRVESLCTSSRTPVPVGMGSFPNRQCSDTRDEGPCVHAAGRKASD